MDSYLENKRIKENIEYLEEQDRLEDENSQPEVISKLKLEHLAPYLPYNLKGKCKMGIMYVNSLYNPSYENNKYNTENPIQGTSSAGTLVSDYNDFKPILRPLSDLLKFKELFNVVNTIKQFQISEKGFYSLNYAEFYDYKKLPYEIVNILFKHHFDVFGLIPKSLAIDVNTLKN
jgi:hypothetical protein